MSRPPIHARRLLLSGLAGGLLAIVPPASSSPATNRFVISLGGNATVCDFDEMCEGGTCTSDGATSCVEDADCPGCFTVQNEDLVLCTPVSLGEGQTQCRWSLFFDGSAAGLTSKVVAVDILPDGDLVMRVNGDNSIPDISGIKRKDLALFSPRDAQGNSLAFQLPYTQGEWRLFLDGDAVKDASDARAWNAVEVLYPDSCRDLNGDETIQPQECDVLLSLASGASLGGIEFKDEDILRCRPTLTPGGTISACEYSLFLDSSQINEPGFPGEDPGNEIDSFQGDLFAFELLAFDRESLTGTLLFRTGNRPTIPSHQASRDLLQMVGWFGPTGACSATSSIRCLDEGDCPGAETCGLPDRNPSTGLRTILTFDGDLPGARVVPDFSAGLGGESIQALAVVPDRDGDDVPDGIDSCPDDPNPPEVCSGGVESCATDGDCPDGETCEQPDADGDGVGDPCDRCNGRDDAVCFCGDFVVDLPSEQCDLGDPELFPGSGFNGLPGSPCSASCEVSGSCTRSPATPCTAASDCPGGPAGEGCCGNGTLEGFCSDGSGPCSGNADCRTCLGGLCADGATSCSTIDDCPETCEPGDEQCDDGNAIEDDLCDGACAINTNPVPLPVECRELLGPNVVSAFVRPLVLTDTNRVPGTDFDRWSTRGEFNLADGIVFDPDSQQVDLILSQESFVCAGGDKDGLPCATAADCPDGKCSSTVYEALLRPGDGDEHFEQKGPAQDKPRWKFKDRYGDNQGARAWTRGSLVLRQASRRRPLNQAKFRMKGRGDQISPQVSIPVDETALGGPPIRLRQTLRVGDLCATQVLTCEVKRQGRKLKCLSLAQ